MNKSAEVAAEYIDRIPNCKCCRRGSHKQFLDSLNIFQLTRDGEFGSTDIDQYKIDASQYRLLTPTEERTIGWIIQHGREAVMAAENARPILGLEVVKCEIELSKRAQTVLAECNLRLVIHEAIKYRDSGIAPGDLIQAGNIGLLEACSKFDITKGCRFSTFAVPWIRKYILELFSAENGVIKYSSHVRSTMAKAARIIESFQQTEEESFDNLSRSQQEAVLRIGGLPEQQISIYFSKLNQSISSLSQPIGDDDSLLEDTIPDIDNPDTAETAVSLAQIAIIRAIIDENFDPRERKLIFLRFFNGGRFCSYSSAELGGEMKISATRVKAIQAKVMAKLRLLLGEFTISSV